MEDTPEVVMPLMEVAKFRKQLSLWGRDPFSFF